MLISTQVKHALLTIVLMALFLMFLMLAFSGNAYAATAFEVDGIKYTVLSEEQKTVQLVSVTDADSVTSIDAEGCWHIPPSVTSPIDEESYSVIKICSNSSFESCCSLVADKVKSLDLPVSITALGDYSFWKCEKLESLVLSSSVSSMGQYVFGRCSSLEHVEACDANLTSLSLGAFSECVSLKDISLPKSLMHIGEEESTDYYLSNSFAFCESLENIELPEGLEDIGNGAFCYCTSLSSVSIPTTVDTIGYMAFTGCGSLVNFDIPDGVLKMYPGAVNNGEYGEGCFSNCVGLKSVSLPGTLISFSGAIFTGCTSLSGFYVSSDNEKYASRDGVVYTKEFNELVAFPLGKELSQGLFKVPAGVDSIGNAAFLHCASLKTLDLSNLSNGGYISDAAFNGASNLDTVIFSDDACLSYISNYAFMNCTSLATFSVPVLTNSSGQSTFDAYGPLWHRQNGPCVAPNENFSIGGCAFKGCTNLETILFRAGCVDGAKYYMQGDSSIFEGDSSLRSIIFESDQCYWVDPYGSAQNYANTRCDIWGKTGGSAPSLYYAVDYYASKEAAVADESVSSGLKKCDGRIARVEYKRGTALKDIATGSAAAAEGAFTDASLYAESTADGFAPDPAEAAGHEGEHGWIWAFEEGYAYGDELTESIYAYPVRATDIGAGHVTSSEVDSIAQQSPKHLESWFNPKTYTLATSFMKDNPDYMAVEGDTGNIDYKYWSYSAAYNNNTAEVRTVTDWFELDSSGSTVEGLAVTSGDGEELVQGTDYTLSWRMYDPSTYAKYPGPAEYAANTEPCAIGNAGAYLMVLEGTGEYGGTLAMWVPAKKSVGTVDHVYGSTSTACTYRLNMNSSTALNTAKAYATVADGRTVGGLVLASCYAGASNGWLVANESKNSTANALYVGTSGKRSSKRDTTLGIGVDASGLQSPTSVTECYARNGEASSMSELANALYGGIDPTEYATSSTKVDAWGGIAVLCPVDLPGWCSSLSAYVYAEDAFCFFLEEDGSVSQATLENLKGFERIVIPGGVSLVPEKTVGQLAKGLPAGVEVIRIASDSHCAGEFSLAVARELVADGKAAVEKVAVVDGLDSNFMAAGITRVGYDKGIVLQSGSVAESKAIVEFLSQNKASVKSVMVMGADEDGDGYADGMSSGSWRLEDQLGFIWDSEREAEVDTASSEGDTFSYEGCLFEIESLESNTAGLLSRFDGARTFAVGDSAGGYMVGPVSSGAYRASMALNRGLVYGGGDAALLVDVPEGSQARLDSSDLGVAKVGEEGALTPTGAGKALVTARVVDAVSGRFVASASTMVEVAPHDVSNCTVDDIAAQAYDEAGARPAVVVRDGSEVLEEGVDYDVSFQGNDRVGTARAVVTGRGNYTGTLEKSFEVVSKIIDVSGVIFPGKTVTYNGKAQSLVATNLPSGVTVSYSGNGKVAAGTYTVTATFSCANSGYAPSVGAKKATLRINRAAQKLTVSKAAKSAKRGKLTSAVKVTGAKGKKTFKKVGGSKYLTVTKAGKVKVSKKAKKGSTYKIRVKVYAGATPNYNKSGYKYATIKVRVK